jgi:SAM-dependent methyltransferase
VHFVHHRRTVTDVTIEHGAVDTLSSCQLCGGASFEALPDPGRWIGPEVFAGLKGRIGLVCCRGCDLVFVNPRPSGELLSAFYSGDTYECHESDGSGSAGTKAAFILGRLTRSLPSDVPRTLLDYGAGGGGFLVDARKLGWDVRGFEPGERGRESCRQSGLDVTGNLDALPRGAFGLVTLHHAFEHVPDPVKVLDGVRPLLAKGGLLFIEVPNCRSLRARIARSALSSRFRVDERYRAFPIHLTYYSPSTLRKMMGKAGWSVVHTFTLGMGIDEFLIRVPSPAHGVADAQPRAPMRRRLRHTLRDAFLGLGMGENVAVVARPV